MPRSGTVYRIGIAMVSLAMVLWGWNASAQSDDDCFMCHGDPNASKTTEDGEVISLYVDQEAYSHSLHGDIGCTTCHADITEVPHPPELDKVDCGMCHMEEAEKYQKSLHGQALSEGDSEAAACADCHSKHQIRSSSDPLSMTNKLNLPQTCGKCHSNPQLVKKHMLSVAKPSAAYLKSVHAQAIKNGNEDAAVCNDCHGTHDILPAYDPESPVYHRNVPDTCGKCHPDVLAEYKKSIHGQALAAGIPDAPICTDCHGEHDIEPPTEESSPVSRQMVSRSTCPRCHDNERIMERYGIETMRQASYMDSYHGMASAAGSKVVANCTSCHGVHNILPPSDPASTVNPDNLVNTCGQCHQDATENFIKGPVHIMPTDPGQRALGIVRLIYIWLIGLILGGMITHNTILMLRHMVSKFGVELKGRNVHRRFNKGLIFGHLVLTIAFITLVITGFALRYPDAWWSQLIFRESGGFEMRSIIHRIAGLVLVGVTVANVLYVILTRSGRKELRALIMTWQDIKDIFTNMGFALGLTKKRPLYDRYSYSEKFEYWGLWWGSVVMIVTGFCMWFADEFLQYFPKLWLDVAALIHFYEAWLAFGTIVIWHLYYMMLDPETYPMNWSWITGNITEEDFKERHPLEYERKVLDDEDEEEGAKSASLRPDPESDGA